MLIHKESKHNNLQVIVEIMNAKSKSVKLSAKYWILTFPKTQATLEEAHTNILEANRQDVPKRMALLEFARVAKELHQDGTPHLHVFLAFKKPLQTRDRHYFDFITGKHGSYETARSAVGSLKYVSKAGEFQDYRDVPSALAKQMSTKRRRGDDPAEDDEKVQKKGKWAQYAELMRDGASATDIAELDPGFYMMNAKKVRDSEAFYKQMKAKVIPERHPGFIKYIGTHLPTQKVVDWLNRNLLSGPREFKQKQLYVWGPGNMLKTTFISSFKKFFRVYSIPTLVNWYDEYSDDVDLCILDEFEGQKSIPWMNLFLQGGDHTLEVKGGHYTKRANPAVVTLSNYSLEINYYPKDVDTLLLRYEIVYTTTPFDIANVFHIEPEVPLPNVGLTPPLGDSSDDCNNPTASGDESPSSPLWSSSSASPCPGPEGGFGDALNQEDDSRLMRFGSAGTARSKFGALYSDSVVAKAIASLKELDLRAENLRLKGKQPESEPDEDTLDPTPVVSDNEEEEERLIQKRHNRFVIDMTEEDE